MDAEERLAMAGTALLSIGILAMLASDAFGVSQPVPDLAWLVYVIGFGWYSGLIAEAVMRHGEPIFKFKNDPPLFSKILITLGTAVALGGATGFLIAPLFRSLYGPIIYGSIAAIFLGSWIVMAGVFFDPDSPSINEQPEETIGGDA